MSLYSHEGAWVALSLALGPRSRRLMPLLARFQTPEAILAATDAEILETLPDIGRGALAALKEEPYRREVTRILSYCERAGIKLLTPDMAEFPQCFLAISEPPAVLYCRGTLPPLGTRPFVGVVGTRKADAYGEGAAYKISFELAAAGAVIVSGMAEGIDGIAAAAAIDAGSATVAILGCGIDIVYPKHHTRLAREIAECGAVLTEFAPGTRPNAWHFPMRNRLISALSEAVVVVQADEKSGALITARYALLQGKSLFAVPGNIDNPLAAGCNTLLRAGARIALSAEDILSHFRFLYQEHLTVAVPDEAMQYAGVSEEKLRAHGIRPAAATKKINERREERPEKAERQEEPLPLSDALAEATASLDERGRAILALLPDTPFSIDHLVARGVAAGEAVATMTLFEILGIVVSRPGGMYQKYRLSQQNTAQ